MANYESFLKKLSVKELKTIVKSMLKHLNIKLTKIKKYELVEHLLKWTDIEDGEIILKSELLDIEVDDIVENAELKSKDKKLTENQLEKKKEKVLKEMGKVSGMLTRKKREYNDIVYESTLMGGKSKTKKVLDDKEKALSEDLSKEIKSLQTKYKSLSMQYNKLKEYVPEKKMSKKMKKEKEEEYEGDDEFKKKKELFRLKARFDRLKKDLEDEKDTKKIKSIKDEMEKIKKDFEMLKKKEVKSEKSRDNENDILTSVNKLFNTKHTYLFINDKVFYHDVSFRKIKKYVKDNLEKPKKDIKGFIIKLRVDEDDSLLVNCTQVTIKPYLFIGNKDNDGSQTFVYSKKDFDKYGFEMEHIYKIIDAVKNHSVSFEKNRINISDVL